MAIKYDDVTNESAEYAAFVKKFQPKKTTDDCYTPANIYDAVRRYAVRTYGLEGRKVLRPFFPGGDYEHADYPDGCVVIDNPPFSILSKICAFYDARGIDYFMFAPSLTLFSINAGRSNYVIANANITYANGARVCTGFVTNLGDYKIHVVPELYAAIKTADDENTKSDAKPPTYDYPHAVINAATLNKMARYVELAIHARDALFIRAMDQQRENKKAIFGGGFLLSERAAAKRAAAERAAAERAAAERASAYVWRLSDRELELQREMMGS